MGGIEFLKGHGTENDFVLLPDPAGRLDMIPSRVAALCDRRRGIGADGVLRVVRASSLSESSAGEWFMDYRNADGSVAEMCGNGVRVFARYLVEAGLVRTSTFVVGSRAGDREVHVHADRSVTVHMGPTRITGGSVATIAGRAFSGVAVDVGNPHLVSLMNEDVVELDLCEEPEYDREFFPHGVNLEFLNRVGPDRLRMRVHERGVGETRACGTGTVAAVAATFHLAGVTDGSSIVDIPGGTVTVALEPGSSTLTGPAAIVAHGELDEAWWAAAGREH